MNPNDLITSPTNSITSPKNSLMSIICLDSPQTFSSIDRATSRLSIQSPSPLSSPVLKRSLLNIEPKNVDENMFKSPKRTRRMSKPYSQLGQSQKYKFKNQIRELLKELSDFLHINSNQNQ